MVAERRGIKSDEVHQCRHGVCRYGIKVIDRVTCAVIARRKDECLFVDFTQAVGDGCQHGHVVEGGMHVVDRKDVQFTGLRRGRCQCREHQKA